MYCMIGEQIKMSFNTRLLPRCSSCVLVMLRKYVYHL
jgi:hypothetical protein